MPFDRLLARSFAFLLLAGCGAPEPVLPPAPEQASVEPAPIEAGLPASAGEYDLAVDILHYDIELALGGSEIEGRVVITLSPHGALELPLDFTGLRVISVTLDGAPSSFSHEAGKMRIPLTAGLSSATVAISYHGTPDDGLIIRSNSRGHPSAFVDNWPNRTRFWLPSVDHPADKATASFTVHAPTGWEVVANGVADGPPRPAEGSALGGAEGKSTTRWTTDVPHPTYTLVVGASDFTIETVGRAACGQALRTKDADGCVDVTFWAYPEDVPFASSVFSRAAAMVDYFAEIIGDYPFEKLANVQSATRFGGMENSSAIFYSEEAISAGQLSEGTVSHEIAHQWFGDAATESDWPHLWLSEGFATYFGALFFEHADGTESFRARMERSRQTLLRSRDTANPIVSDHAPANLFELLNDNNYEKGGWVLHMLRGVLGDGLFFDGIRAYYEKYLYGNASTRDFQRVIEEVAGQDLEWFFRQWLYQPGFPTLSVDWEWDPEANEVVLAVAQTQRPEWPTYQMPAEVHLRTAEVTDTVGIEIRERAQTVRIPAANRPDQVALDPDRWILRGGR